MACVTAARASADLVVVASMFCIPVLNFKIGFGGAAKRGNAQTAQQTGRNNVAVQSQAGACNHQSIRQSGGGNVAVQSQSGRVLQSASVQPGNGR